MAADIPGVANAVMIQMPDNSEAKSVMLLGKPTYQPKPIKCSMVTYLDFGLVAIVTMLEQFIV